jgi:hypothetical protein
MIEVFGNYSNVLTLITYFSFGVIAGTVWIYNTLAEYLIQKNYSLKRSKYIVSTIRVIMQLFTVWCMFFMLIFTAKTYPHEQGFLYLVIVAISMAGTIYFHRKFILTDQFVDK